MIDILAHNRRAWDKYVDEGNCWTVPVDSAAIARARDGDLSILLTPVKPIPSQWFPDLTGLATLCLASGGGQQGPLLAAAGADVTVFDNSPKQLAQDRFVAEREDLMIRTVQGDMADLSAFPDASFGMIVHPCSNCFVRDVRPVWEECFRVLQIGGVLLSGFCNPIRFAVEDGRLNNGVLTVRYRVPTSDAEDRGEEVLQTEFVEKLEVLEFGHTLEDQIGGQLQAGFVIVGFYEDRCSDQQTDPISAYMDTFVATRALKPLR